jgi:thiol-disulfide isomerase/thioredoxin
MSILRFSLLLTLSFILLTGFKGPEKKMPSVDLKTLDGKVVNSDSFTKNNKVSIVSFWATWCTPCKKELDIYHELYDEWVEAYDVEFVAITIDNARALAKVKPLVAQKGWKFTVLSDVNEDLKKQLNFIYVPQTYILDKEGNIVFDHSGFAPGDEYEMEEVLEELSAH